MNEGYIKFIITDNRYMPVANASVTITDASTGITIYEERTDDIGQTSYIPLSAPKKEYSDNPTEYMPYSQYNTKITFDSGNMITVDDIQIYPDVYSALYINSEANAIYAIPENTLYGDYPPKIPESEVKPIYESGNIVLDSIVVPEYIVVHDGAPSDTTAQNYYIKYKDYIKNVASSEIYSTWPYETIKANVISIISFTLNRVYTEWYRNKGYNFTITSSTAFDHKWILKRNIYDNISEIVDSVFNQYISKPNVYQPLLAQYCDGIRTTCPRALSQWGSKYLGDKGLTALDILKTYYGSDVYINSASEVAGVPISWPRENLMIGSTGEKVRFIQSALNRISDNYPLIPKLVTDGIYGPKTRNSVIVFQKIFCFQKVELLTLQLGTKSQIFT